jgi:hypothetical protein
MHSDDCARIQTRRRGAENGQRTWSVFEMRRMPKAGWKLALRAAPVRSRTLRSRARSSRARHDYSAPFLS